MLAADLGSAFLLAGLALAVFSAVAGARAGRRGDAVLARTSRRALYATAAATAGASATLLAALLGRDFALAYVTAHTDRGLSPALTAAAFYGGQEGSLLYWALLLTLAGSAALAVAPRPAAGPGPPASRSGGEGPPPPVAAVRLGAYANAFLAGIVAFFLLVLVFVASPFALLGVTPADGLGLNPVLRDGGMLIHPPFLLAGYSAFAVPFAFAMAALLAGAEDGAWSAHVRRFALVAWGLQSAGLTLGMWWAYHVLGWGGYWGWDPVENAALMPWLATTAYLHAARAGERRGTLRAWSSGLVIVAFLLSILGTFVVRSGVLPSVHSFAVSPLGPWFFGFLVVCVAASGALMAWRSGSPAGPRRPVEDALSREGALVAQNAVFVALIAAVLWGTLLPLLSGMIGRELVVGPAYYERAGAPLFVAGLALLAVGPLLPWRRAGGAWLRDLRPPLVAGVIALAALLAGGARQVGALVALPLVAAGLATCLVEYARGAAFARRLAGPWPLAAARVAARKRRRYGAFLAHAGILVAVAGIGASHLWQQSREVTLRPGESVTVAGHTLTYEGTAQRPAGDHTELTASLRMGGETLAPARLTYPALGGQAVTRVAIRSTPVDDVYVVLAGPADAGAAAFEVFVNPLVTWIWAGAALLVTGVLLGGAAWPQARPAPAPAAVAAGAPAAAGRAST